MPQKFLFAMMVVVIVACLPIVSVIRFHLGDSHKTELELLSYVGAWFQGVLTPVALVLTLWTFAKQSADQSDANRSVAQAVFIANVAGFASQIGHRCVTALTGVEAKHEPGLSDAGLTVMEKRLQDVPGSLEDHGYDYREISKAEMRASAGYRQLRKEIEAIARMGETVDMDGLLDGRIGRIRTLIAEQPPT